MILGDHCGGGGPQCLQGVSGSSVASSVTMARDQDVVLVGASGCIHLVMEVSCRYLCSGRCQMQTDIVVEARACNKGWGLTGSCRGPGFLVAAWSFPYICTTVEASDRHQASNVQVHSWRG